MYMVTLISKGFVRKSLSYIVYLRQLESLTINTWVATTKEALPLLIVLRLRVLIASVDLRG